MTATALSVRTDTERGAVSTALWRNLGGWPATNPYRSIGVEPMLGHAFDLARAAPHDQARVPASGELCWRLTNEAAREDPASRGFSGRVGSGE